MLHIHIILVTPLSSGYVAEPGTNQHGIRATVWKAAYHPGTTANLPVEPFYDIFYTDSTPMLAGRIAVSKSLLNTLFYLLGSLLQLHETQFLHHSFRFFLGRFLAFLGIDHLEHQKSKFFILLRAVLVVFSNIYKVSVDKRKILSGS